jgi:NAD-dependent deacetylase
MHNDALLQRAAELIGGASRMVVLTGAGMSTEAGIPDFRSPSGWWKQIDPLTVATVDALESNYELFHAFYTHRIEQLADVSPHRGHFVIAKWEQEGRVGLTATQNVDGLHRTSGSERTSELHGTITTCRCQKCGGDADQADFIAKCTCRCGGKLRPNVVLFGERLPLKAWEQAEHAIRTADVLLVIGTSLQVAPVNLLPSLTRGARILINTEPTGREAQFDVALTSKAGETLDAIDELIV